jgi:hypothetical protein
LERIRSIPETCKRSSSKSENETRPAEREEKKELKRLLELS